MLKSYWFYNRGIIWVSISKASGGNIFPDHQLQTCWFHFWLVILISICQDPNVGLGPLKTSLIWILLFFDYELANRCWKQANGLMKRCPWHSYLCFCISVDGGSHHFDWDQLNMFHVQCEEWWVRNCKFLKLHFIENLKVVWIGLGNKTSPQKHGQPKFEKYGSRTHARACEIFSPTLGVKLYIWNFLLIGSSKRRGAGHKIKIPLN